MFPLNLSVNMVVRNEAHRVWTTLANLRPYVKEIVLADQDSVDDTVKLAAPFVDKLLHHPAYGRCEPSRHPCAEVSTYEWILVVDADERITDEGWKFIAEAITNPRFDVCYLTIENYVGGRFVQRDLMACPRLFRYDAVHFQTHLHGIITPLLEASVTYAGSPVVFVHEKTVEEQQADWDRYSLIEGRSRGTWTEESRFT